MRYTSGNNRAGDLYDFAGASSIDRNSIEQGLPEIQLMGQAALASALSILNMERDHEKGKVLVFCGSGNNGGDGYAIAYMLLGAGFPPGRIHVFSTKPPSSASSSFYREKIEENGVRIQEPAGARLVPLSRGDILLEALLGTGQRGAPAGPVLESLKIIRSLKSEQPGITLISIDLPAGLSEDTPVSFSRAIPSDSEEKTFSPALPDRIHTYGVNKICLALHPELNDSSYVQTSVFPIGFSPLAIQGESPVGVDYGSPLEPEFFLKTGGMHKYNAGSGILIGGSEGMEGAGIMALDAFFASGGGILHGFFPTDTSSQKVIQSRPSVMSHTLGELPDLLEKGILSGPVLIGPGFSKADLNAWAGTIFDFLKKYGNFYKQKGVPFPGIILDAGATTLLLSSDFPDPLRKDTLITPHTGEWKTLGGEKIQTVQTWKGAGELVRNVLGCQAIIKDSISSIFLETLDGERRDGVFSSPNPGLAVAGSGDVLAGILLAGISRNGPGSPSLQRTVSMCLALHRECGIRTVHPRADEFPELIRIILKESQPGIPGDHR